LLNVLDRAMAENGQAEGRMRTTPGNCRKYDLDLSRIGDEELVVLAQECGYQPAAHALIVRLHPWVNGLIFRKAGHTKLGAADVDDAGQEAVFWMLEGIASYNTLELARPKGCRFRTFLYTLVACRFIDFTRRVWRRESHLDRQARFVGPEANLGTIGITPRNSARLNQDNPASALIGQENRMRLQSALDRLGEQARRLWDCLAAGMPLRDIAREQCISYPQAKRRRRQLLANLVAQFRDQAEKNGC
jgi:RNA polymerase sigma factor (sigma-70 family)